MRDSPVITLLLLFLIILTPASAACVLGQGNTIQLVDGNPVTCDYDVGPPITCAGCTLDGVLNEWDCVINEGDGTCGCSPPVTTDCGFAESCKRDSGTGSAYCEEACLDTGAVQRRRCDAQARQCIEDQVQYYTGPVDAAVACSGGDEDKRLCFYCDVTGKLMADTCLVSDVTGKVFTAVGELQKDCNPDANPCQVDVDNNIVYCDLCSVDEGVEAVQARCNGNLHKCQQSTDSCYSGNAPLEAACDATNAEDINCEFCESDGSIVTSGCTRQDGQATCDESAESGDCLPELAEGQTTFQCGSQDGGSIQCSRCINDVDNARFAVGETRRCVMPAAYGDPITCDPLPEIVAPETQCYLVESGDPPALGPPPGAPAIENACIEDLEGENGGITCQYCSISGVARDARCDVEMASGSVVCSDEPLPLPEDLEVEDECLEDAQWHYACNDPDNDPDDLDECRVMLDAEGADTFSKNCDRCRLDAEENSVWRVQRCNYDADAHTATCDRQDVGCGGFSRCSWNSSLDAYTDPDHLRLLQFTCADPDPRCILADTEAVEDRETCESAPYDGQWDAGFLHCVVPGIIVEDDCAGLAFDVEWFGDPLPMCLPDTTLTQNIADVFGPADTDYFGDEPGGTAEVFDPGVDEIFATDDGDNGLYDGTEEVLSDGANGVQDTLAGTAIFPLYDEDPDNDVDDDGDGRIDEDPPGFGWNDDRDYRYHYCMGGAWYSCVHPQEFEDVTLQVLADAGGDPLDPTYRAQKESYYVNLNATLIAEEIDDGLPGEDGQCCATEFLETLEIVTRTILGTDEDELPRVYACQETDLPYVIRAPYSDEMNAMAPDPVNDPWAPDSIDDSLFQQELAERWGDEGNRTHQCDGSSMCIDLDLGMCCPGSEADHCKFCRVFSLTDDLDDPNADCVATDCFDPDCPGSDCPDTQCRDLDDLADNCFQGCTHALFLPAEDCDETAICEGHMVQPPPFSCCDSVGVEGCSYPDLTDFDVYFGADASYPCNSWGNLAIRSEIRLKCEHMSAQWTGVAVKEFDVTNTNSFQLTATITSEPAIDRDYHSFIAVYDGDVVCDNGDRDICTEDGVSLSLTDGWFPNAIDYCNVELDQASRDCDLTIDTSALSKVTILYALGDGWDLVFDDLTGTVSDLMICSDDPDAPTSELPANDCCYWLADQYATAINDGSFPTPYYCLNPEEPDPTAGVNTHWCALGKRAGSECNNVKECATFATLPGHGDCEENVCLGRDLDVFFNDLITYPAPDEDDQCEITENLAQCGIDQDNYLLRALYPPMTQAELECSYEDGENSFAPLADLAISMRENMETYCTVREPISTSLCNNFFNSIGFTSCLTPVDPPPTLEELDSALIVPIPEEEEEEE